ncbi:MAG TPA: molybdopterin-guanine dinucleotide biosynthesis protein B [Pseudogracilibacillus sp.]|nr:molybdopterin-guanine dinucleotide biosynthesis protein B [Pseudogracilibacillus sp.]
MEPVKLIHIVGFKNSGKTTLINNWIQIIKSLGLKVAVIKHHGHGAKLAMPDESKDSMQYLKNGADASIVAGSGHTQHITADEMDYASLKQLALLKKPDVILVEGYKQEPGEKVILVKDEADWRGLEDLGNIQLVVGLKRHISYPQIADREHIDALNNWLKKWLQSSKEDFYE